METGTVKLWDYAKPIKARHAGPCGPYTFARQPLRGAGDRCKGFTGYLSSDGSEVNEGTMVRLRVEKASDIISLRHSGWYCDEECHGIMYGVVAILPRSRGFLAGWSLGEGMATSFDGFVWDTIEDAARAADEEARVAADREREFQVEENRRLDAEELYERD